MSPSVAFALGLVAGIVLMVLRVSWAVSHPQPKKQTTMVVRDQVVLTAYGKEELLRAIQRDLNTRPMRTGPIT